MFGPVVKVLHTGIDGIAKELSNQYSDQSREIAKGAEVVKQRASELQRMSVSIGIPEASARDRQRMLEAAFGKLSGNSAKVQRRRQNLVDTAAQNLTNAQLLWIQSKGSPARGIPARPVLEPAIESEDGRAAIQPELAAVIQQTLAGKKREAIRHLKRAGMAGRNAARREFFAQNGWAPLKRATIKQKGSSQPLIDTGAMRNAITFVVDEG